MNNKNEATLLCRPVFVVNFSLFVFIYRQRLVYDFVPGEAVAADLLHERIGIELFDVEDAFAFPLAGEDHLGAEHGRNAGGVGNCLSADFLVASSVVAVVIHIVGTLFAVFDTFDLAADGGLSVITFAQRRRFWQYGFQELQRNDVDALVFNRLDAGHTDFL